MTKTLKQFKEDMQIYKWNIHRNVYINVYSTKGDNVSQETYTTEEEFFEATKYNNKKIKCVEVFSLTNQTHIDILVGGN